MALTERTMEHVSLPPVQFRLNQRAKRYLLRFSREGCLMVTIPRRGNRREALQFVARSQNWIETHRQKWEALTSHANRPWGPGDTVLFRGKPVVLQPVWKGRFWELGLGSYFIRLESKEQDLRGPAEILLRSIARDELPRKVFELAGLYGVAVRRVTIRDQKTRWGSCSSMGTISLNWRLIQTPAFVRRYVILHELMHRFEMNHSTRFWKRLASAMPEYREAETWLKEHSLRLGLFS